MNYKILTVLFISVLSFTSLTFIPDKIKKKVVKEVSDVFETEEFQLIPVEVTDEINSTLPLKITGENFFKLTSDNNLLGYVFIDDAPSKTARFDYMVIFDAALIIKRTKVLVYREEYGGEIGSKRWLRQFEGKTKADSLNNVMAISGATISVNSMTNAVNDLLKTVNILYEHKIVE
ncbi:FMN-binding protein [Abyssalbus ytuae]|uniref:FMN-binding protein n=1 Tax=Abyssalbus ytuae TaxID=2926907 RepID=A0A9E6ZUE7_9FLAO|nr:FMN-binding protein [Abyssalbus ytuae]UOB17998.1 FMN-binding protein [Abyssalbus ytuae]